MLLHCFAPIPIFRPLLAVHATSRIRCSDWAAFVDFSTGSARHCWLLSRATSRSSPSGGLAVAGVCLVSSQACHHIKSQVFNTSVNSHRSRLSIRRHQLLLLLPLLDTPSSTQTRNLSLHAHSPTFFHKLRSLTLWLTITTYLPCLIYLTNHLTCSTSLSSLGPTPSFPHTSPSRFARHASHPPGQCGFLFHLQPIDPCTNLTRLFFQAKTIVTLRRADDFWQP